jgi:hypothetical protein
LSPVAHDSINDVLRSSGLSRRDFFVVGTSVVLYGDDAVFFDEFDRLFGGMTPSATDRQFEATVRAEVGSEFGSLEIAGDPLSDGAAFLLGFATPTVPFTPLPGVGGDTRVGLDGSTEPLFVFAEGTCRFRKVDRWRRIVSHFIFLRLLRLRPELLFFHAASLRVSDSGALIIGPKGTGKTTLSLAIAAAGNDLLGDETAAFEMRSGLLHAVRRPASIKPGRRSTAIDARLGELECAPDEDGLLHVRPDDLFAAAAVETAPLRAVFFLEGFGSESRIESVTPGRDELAALQPLRCSALADAPSRNVFAMIRLLNSVRCYRVHAGDPDETAHRMIEVMKHEVVRT